MVDLINRLAHMFHLGINDARFVFKKRRQITAADITIFINGGGQDSPVVVLKPAIVISASAEKRHTKRSAGNDHRATELPLRFYVLI